MAGLSPQLQDVFTEYETDLNTLLSSISSQLNKDAKEQKDARKTVLRRVDRELEEADEIIGQMEIEVQTASRDQKVPMQSKVRQFKATLNGHKSNMRTLAATSSRDELLSSSTSEHIALDMDPDESSPGQVQRSRLLSATDKLSEGQRRLEDSHRVALETEDLGAGILRDLRGQRDQLEHTRDSLYEADGSIDRASGTLKKMVRRMYQQRAATYAIIGVLVFLILYVLFSKLFG